MQLAVARHQHLVASGALGIEGRLDFSTGGQADAELAVAEIFRRSFVNRVGVFMLEERPETALEQALRPMHRVGGTHASEQVVNVAPGEEMGVGQIEIVLMGYHSFTPCAPQATLSGHVTILRSRSSLRWAAL